MKITLVFPSSEATDVSIGLVFAPCALWVQGNKIILNPHPSNPHYCQGDAAQMLALPQLQEVHEQTSRVVTVVVHTNGNGSEQDMGLLLQDLEDLGWRPVVVQLAG